MNEIEKMLEDGTYNVIGELQRKMVYKFDNKLEDYVKRNLSQLGHEFSSKVYFHDFCKKRITRASFVNDPHCYDIYLDYVSEENRGTLIGCYSDKFKIVNEGNKVTAIIG
jgi:hypothetical protein